MNGIQVDFNKTVYELCQEHPIIINILAELGFAEITHPGMLQSAGRFMTIPKGAALRNIDFALVRRAFMEHSFEIVEGGQCHE